MHLSNCNCQTAVYSFQASKSLITLRFHSKHQWSSRSNSASHAHFLHSLQNCPGISCKATCITAIMDLAELLDASISRASTSTGISVHLAHSSLLAIRNQVYLSFFRPLSNGRALPINIQGASSSLISSSDNPKPGREWSTSSWCASQFRWDTGSKPWKGIAPIDWGCSKLKKPSVSWKCSISKGTDESSSPISRGYGSSSIGLPVEMFSVSPESMAAAYVLEDRCTEGVI